MSARGDVASQQGGQPTDRCRCPGRRCRGQPNRTVGVCLSPRSDATSRRGQRAATRSAYSRCSYNKGRRRPETELAADRSSLADVLEGRGTRPDLESLAASGAVGEPSRSPLILTQPSWLGLPGSPPPGWWFSLATGERPAGPRTATNTTAQRASRRRSQGDQLVPTQKTPQGWPTFPGSFGSAPVFP